ncbi:MAG TPA: MscL family protein [Candidatus Saccharimonadales bacterium]|nr:MscL family protein [Candidatus Saccharimonadales bacterium]
MAQSRKRKSTTVHTVTPGTTIRFEEPTSDRKPKPNPAVVVVQEANPVGGFVAFLREHAIVGLAIGFIVGLQAQTLVKQLVSSFIDPAFQLFFGKALQDRTFTLHFGNHTAAFGWGAFVYILLNFIFVLAAIYMVVKFFNLEKLDKPPKKKIDSMKEKDHHVTVIQ